MKRTVSAPRVATLLRAGGFPGPGGVAYRELADGLRLLIADGRVPPGTRLPSERELTGALAVSRTTVAGAYALLRERGYLESRRGSGSLARLPRPAAGGTADALLAPYPDGDAIDLTVAAPVAPHGIASAYEAAQERLPGYLAGTGYFPSGLPVLREAIAARYAERGLPTCPEQVVVTAGALSAVAVAARSLLGTGDRVLTESPTYPNALAALRGSGARVVGVGVDPDGWDLDAVEAALRQTAPRAAYLVPDFQNPTGALLTEEQRARLGRALGRSRTTVIADETLTELALDEVRVPAPLAVWAPGAVSVGSASKAFWGGLRIGWLRVPPERVGHVVAARLGADLGAPVLEQLVLAELLGRREQVVAEQRAALRRSRAALVAALTRHLPSWRFRVPAGGLALWCELPEPRSSALVVAAERHGVRLAPGPAFAPEGGLERFVRLPYARGAEELTLAVERLAAAWEEALRRRSPGRSGAPLVA